MEWIVSDTVAGAEEAAAHFIAARLRQAVSERARATLAISGGTTPWGLFERLAAQDLDWSAVHLFQVDERIVPPDHEARNWKRVLASSLAQRLAGAQLHGMPVEIDDPELAAARYAETLREWTGSTPVLDIVHLGLGADGHTASLFAGDPLLEERQRPVGASGRHEKYRRLSLTLPMLNGARCIVWFVVGAARREALARLFVQDRSIPASQVEGGRAVCFTDSEAAPAM